MARREGLAARRPLAAAVTVLALIVCVSGCVSMPSGGPVLSSPITQGPDGQGQHYLQIIPQSPGDGWTPQQIVYGFLTASASFADRQQVARKYLTAEASSKWRPSWSAAVFSGSGPIVSGPVFTDSPKNQQAMVTVSGPLQANLSEYGAYAVPSASGTQAEQPTTFKLVKDGGQWRIASVPPRQLLLTSVQFQADYQLRNLYFVDPNGQFLIPDPAYVPLQATPADVMSGLVQDLIDQPSDWLSGGTRTAFPGNTKLLTPVTVAGGLATVNLGGGIAKAQNPVREQVSAQLLSTLSGSGQGQQDVQAVALYIDGKPWFPPKTPDNPVQNSNSSLTIPTGASNEFYYLNSGGDVMRKQGAAAAPVQVENIGTGYSAIAVSPDGHYLAALRDGTLFTGQLGGRLVKRDGTGYTSMSWDPGDDLWTTSNGEVFVLHGNVTQQSRQSPQAAPITVNVLQLNGLPESNAITGVRVAPDGVRVALVVDDGSGSTLAFGAIGAMQLQGQAREGQPTIAQITLSPFSVSSETASFSGVTWYGPDNVITLGTVPGEEGPVLTEYSVNGGTPTTISSDADIRSITASAGSELIAGTKDGVLLADASTSGAWASIGSGLAPAYPG